MKNKGKAVVAAAVIVAAVGTAAQPAFAGSTTNDAFAGPSTAGVVSQKAVLRAAVGFATSTARHLASTKAIRHQVSSALHFGSVFTLGSAGVTQYDLPIDKAFDR